MGQKIWTPHQSRETDAKFQMSLWKYKLKPQCDTAEHLVEWPESRTLTTNAGTWGNRNSCPLLLGMQDGAATWQTVGSFLEN